MNEVSERTILEEGNIKITNLRAIIGSKTYAMAGISSVSLTVRHDRGLIPLTLIIIGAVIGFFFVISSINPEGVINWELLIIGGIIVLAFFGLGFLIHVGSKPLYFIKLESSSGEMNILQSYDRNQIRRVVDAVNEAIVRRG